MGIYSMRVKFGHGSKWVMAILAFIFIVGAIFMFGGAPKSGMRSGGSENGNVVLANVNGSDITRSEFEASWQQERERAQQSGVVSSLKFARLRAQTFQQLVQGRLLVSAASSVYGVDVSKSAISAEQDKRIEDYLKVKRHTFVDKISPEEERTDPRQDTKFIKALGTYGRSLNDLEQMAEEANPPGSIITQLAVQGVREAIQKKAGIVSDQDINDSYKQYNIQKIALYPGKLPKEQLTAKANKLAEEARKPGSDFAKLAKENSDDKGPDTAFSFDTQMMYPPEMALAIKKLKPGEVSGVIDAGQAIYIVKLNGVTDKMPANLDKKAREARRKQMQQMAEMAAGAAFSKTMNEKSTVNVMDNEMNAYWHLYQAQNYAMDPAKYNSELVLAEAAFKRQLKNVKNDSFSGSLYAQLLLMQGKDKEAALQLRGLLEGRDSTAQGADLRIMYADLLAKQGQKDEAIRQYQKASQSGEAVMDSSIHKQLMSKFKSIGRVDLASAEDATAKDIDQKMKEYQARMKAPSSKTLPTAPKSAPAAPTAPKQGG